MLCDTGIHHLRLLFILGRLALFMFLPLWFFYDFNNLLDEVFNNSITYNIVGLSIIDGILSWLQNIIAFSVMSIVTPLTYAVASASKRIFVIAITLFILGNPVTGLNIFGMTLAIFGVLSYNMAKYKQKQLQKKIALLPRYTNKTDSNFANGWPELTHQRFAV